jgi:hypothetical protein
MKTFYFIGGPKPGQAKEFFQRLARAGGSPANWRVYPHVANDDKALHVVQAESVQDILDHLHAFQDIYEHSEIIEVRVSAR